MASRGISQIVYSLQLHRARFQVVQNLTRDAEAINDTNRFKQRWWVGIRALKVLCTVFALMESWFG